MAWTNQRPDGTEPVVVTQAALRRIERVRRDARAAAPRAVALLVECMDATTASWGDRRAAARDLLQLAIPSVHELRVKLQAGRRGDRRYPEIPTDQLKAALRIVSSHAITSSAAAAVAPVLPEPAAPKPEEPPK